MTPEQGEIWWAEARDKRRPVLVVTRSSAIPALTTILVAPVTRKVRGIPTEIALGAMSGAPHAGAAKAMALYRRRVRANRRRLTREV